MDVVNLGMKVDSRPLAKATDEVHQFSRAGKTAAKDVARFGAGAKAGFTQASVAATAATSAFRMALSESDGVEALGWFRNPERHEAALVKLRREGDDRRHAAEMLAQHDLAMSTTVRRSRSTTMLS